MELIVQMYFPVLCIESFHAFIGWILNNSTKEHYTVNKAPIDCVQYCMLVMGGGGYQHLLLTIFFFIIVFTVGK